MAAQRLQLLNFKAKSVSVTQCESGIERGRGDRNWPDGINVVDFVIMDEPFLGPLRRLVLEYMTLYIRFV